MICRHNTILALKFKGSVSHIVDTSEEKNLVMVSSLNEHLLVPRYEPSTAKKWMKEKLTFNEESEMDEEYEKVLLSEQELSDIVKECMLGGLSYTNSLIKVYKEQVA